MSGLAEEATMHHPLAVSTKTTPAVGEDSRHHQSPPVFRQGATITFHTATDLSLVAQREQAARVHVSARCASPGFIQLAPVVDKPGNQVEM